MAIIFSSNSPDSIKLAEEKNHEGCIYMSSAPGGTLLGHDKEGGVYKRSIGAKVEDTTSAHPPRSYQAFKRLTLMAPPIRSL